MTSSPSICLQARSRGSSVARKRVQVIPRTSHPHLFKDMTMSKQVAVLRSSSVERRTVPPGPFARAPNLSRARLKFVNHPSFDDPSAKSAILAPYPDLTGGGCPGPVSLPFRLAPLPGAEVAAPFLSREQEAYLFRK